MELCDILRFQISSRLHENQFQIQKHYFKSISATPFNECLWLASNAERVFGKCEILKIKKVMPLNVILKTDHAKYVFIKNYKLQNLQLLQYILEHEFDNVNQLSFDEESFYFLYKEIIENYFNGNNVNISKFYIEYGFWNKMKITIIDPYVLIASNDKFINTNIDDNNDVTKTMKIFFDDPFVYKYDFNPYVYIASNYKDLNGLVDCAGKINFNRVVKHFIRNPERRFMQFDMWEYLANNIKRIEELMDKSENGKVLWDQYKLTPANTAYIFVKHKGKCQHNVFKDAEFIKAYVDDFFFVNVDKKLSLENACMYFVKTYVKYEEIRHKYTIWYRLLTFLQARVFDSVKQVPFNATRFLIESRCV
jgi:hypothetical protein